MPDSLTHITGAAKRRWLITGVAGFIGSHLLETLLLQDQEVVGVDNFATGHRRSLEEVRTNVGPARWARFRLIKGDIRDLALCRTAMEEVQVVLHHAGLGSASRSMADPVAVNAVNVGGFLNVLLAAQEAGVSRVVYASSSAVYGDQPEPLCREEKGGQPLSPYAVTALANEQYAGVFTRCYGLETIGLRYFNVFGARQDPTGAYATVIPRWTAAMLAGDPVVIYGDGETSRDFCPVANAVHANLLAAASTNPDVIGSVCNVAVGARTTLNELFAALRDTLVHHGVQYDELPRYTEPREGDMSRSQADLSRSKALLSYQPRADLRAGLSVALPWYVRHYDPRRTGTRLTSGV